jgi:hypothetical protein
MKLKTWNAHNINDGTNYEAILQAGAYSLPDSTPVMAARSGTYPKFASLERNGKMIYFDIFIRAIASRATLQSQLYEWFDPDDETVKLLVAEDAAGGGDRQVYGICRELHEVEFGAGLQYVIGIEVSGDPLWRETSATTDSWSITASGQTKSLTNNGKGKAYPYFTIRPTSNKTGGYSYKRWVSVRWNVSAAYTRYPIDIGDDAFDTATLTTAKMQADGDDLRVIVDGVEVDRWLDGMDSASTKVWVNLDFSAKQETVLATAIASSGSITTIDVTGDISGYPSTGILVIDSEAFVYTGKIDSSSQFTGVTRASKGTSMAAHTTTDTVWWCQHDVWILYGNSSATAPSVTSTNEPVIELDDSTNTSWDYDEFRDAAGLRPGSWSNVIGGYGSNQYGTAVDPWVECGVVTPSSEFDGIMRVYNPCGITNANFANGEKYAVLVTDWGTATIQSSIDGVTWTDEDTIAAPGSDNTWEAWSDSEALTSGSLYVQLKITAPTGKRVSNKVEAADVTLTLNSSNTPTIVMGAEQGNYSLDCVIANTTTGKSIAVEAIMTLNQYLMINTDDKLVYLVDDGSNQFQALSIVGGPRRDWLALNAGANTISFTDTGTNGVTIAFGWYERHYH